MPDYVAALCREIEFLAASTPARLPVYTLFFGGGTPSLLPAEALERILHTLQACFTILPEAEVTLEANPGTVSPAYLHALRSLGINRLSLGVQSANPAELRLLERQHDYQDVIQAVMWARQAGFDNLNLDLIFGLPEQKLETWQHTLELGLGLHPQHFSLYALTLEHGTPLGHWAGRGLLPEPDPDVAADMYEWASQRLADAGYIQYEISNWAKRAGGEATGEILACRHNLQYWRNQPYLGFGAGAHGFAGGVRTVDVLAPAAYIQRCLEGQAQAVADGSGAGGSSMVFPRTPATITAQPVDREAEIGETMMMGLRLTQEGVSNQAFCQRFGQTLDEVFPAQIEELQRYGLLEWAGERLRLTSQGRLLGNQVFMRFI